MSVSLLTVSWRQDLERFALLRRSLERWGLANRCHHVVVVHTEDVALFAPLCGRGVELVPSRDLLHPQLERRRRAALHRRTDWRHYVKGGHLAGWYSQQLLKLAAASVATTDVVLVLDSDLVQTRPLPDSELYDGARPKIFISPQSRGDGSPAWNATAARFLGLQPDEHESVEYIHAPYVLDVQVVRRMLGDPRVRQGARHWQLALSASNVFEYPLYGVWARTFAAEDVVPAAPLSFFNVSEYEDLWTLQPDFATVCARSGAPAFASVQSRLHIPANSYAHVFLPE